MPPRPLILAVCAVCAALSLSACGSIGEPLYPATYIPVAIADLNAVQRGSKILVVFTIPAISTDGLRLKEVGAIDMRAGITQSVAFQTEAWAASATPFAVASPGQPAVVRGEIPIAGFIGGDVVVGARVASVTGHFSSWSNLAMVKIERPLDTPSALTVTPTPDGVALRWQPGNASAWRVFRKTDLEKEPTLLGEVDKPEYLDTTTVFDTHYAYFVQAWRETLESDVAGPADVTPVDKFPPPVPAGLTAISGANGIELNWERVTSGALKDYRLYRAEGDAAFTLLADHLTAPTYSDTKVESGKKYRYAVASVSQAGNVSDRSAPAEATAP